MSGFERLDRLSLPLVVAVPLLSVSARGYQQKLDPALLPNHV